MYHVKTFILDLSFGDIHGHNELYTGPLWRTVVKV